MLISYLTDVLVDSSGSIDASSSSSVTTNDAAVVAREAEVAAPKEAVPSSPAVAAIITATVAVPVVEVARPTVESVSDTKSSSTAAGVAVTSATSEAAKPVEVIAAVPLGPRRLISSIIVCHPSIICAAAYNDMYDCWV